MRLTCRADQRPQTQRVCALAQRGALVLFWALSQPALAQAPSTAQASCHSLPKASLSLVALQMHAKGRDEQALAQLRHASAQSCPTAALAQRLLGEVLYSSSNALTAREGLAWLERAAALQPSASVDANPAAGEGERITAMASLGRRLLFGNEHLPGNASAAIKPLEIAAQSGLASAQLHLGLALQQKGADDQGLHWLAMAANHPTQPQPQAMFLLANALRQPRDTTNGSVLPSDGNALAVQWYRRATALEYAPAVQALAMAYLHGELGLPQNPAWAAQLMALLRHAVQHPQPGL